MRNQIAQAKIEGPAFQQRRASMLAQGQNRMEGRATILLTEQVRGVWPQAGGAGQCSAVQCSRGGRSLATAVAGALA